MRRLQRLRQHLSGGYPHPLARKRQAPIVLYPGECYYCGACVMACPHDGAIRLEHPLMNRAKFVPVRYPEEK